MNVYLSNLPGEVTADDLRKVFGAFGRLGSVTVVIDRATNKQTGFGIVDMPEPGEARTAIAALDGKRFKGQVVAVTKTRPHLPPH